MTVPDCEVPVSRARRLALLAVLAACGGDAQSPNPPPPPPPPGPSTPALVAIYAGDQQRASPNAPVPVTPAVVVRDAQGSPVAGVRVTFAVEAGGGTIGTPDGVTGTDGIARAGAWVLGPMPGENRLRASAGALSTTLTATAELRVTTVVVPGAVAVPAGSQLVPVDLRVVTGLTATPVSAAGGFSTIVEPGSVQLAGVHAPSGEPVLFGWLDASPRVLGTRSTAEVLAYFDAGGFILPDTLQQRRLREHLATQVSLGALEAAIAHALAAPPAHVTLLTPAVTEARIAVVTALAATVAAVPGPHPSILIDQTGEQSGVTVDQSGYRSLTITNYWRRRVFAFVDRVGYTPKGSSQEVPSPQSGQPIRIGAVTSATSVVGTIVDLLFGTFAWVPTVAPTQTVPLVPADALRTRYRITVVGGGLPRADVALSPTQAQKQLEAEAETILFDLVIPVIDQFLNAQNLARYLNNQQDYDTILHQFLDLNPSNLLGAIGAGDWRGFLNELAKLLFDSGAGQKFLTEMFIIPFQADKGLAAIQGADQLIEEWSRVLTAVEVFATLADVAFVLKGLADARETEVWEVAVNGATVNLTPSSATIFTHESPNIEAFVLEATGGTDPAPAFMYRWTTTGQAGKLCVSQTTQGGSYCGLAFDSPRDIVAYAPHGLVEGTDLVKVEVFLLEGTSYHAVGEATSTITVRAPQVDIAPVNQSVLPGQTVNFTGQVDAQLQDGGTLTYRWRTPGAFGSFGSGTLDIESTQASVGYVANPTNLGTDPITLEVYSTKDGTRRLLGSASGSVEVTEQPTIVQGTWFISNPVPLDPGRSCILAVLSFPLVPNATSYELHAYGFNDFATGRTEISEVLTPPFSPWKDCSLAGWAVNGANGNEYWMMLSGGAGPNAALGSFTSSFQSRFGGMTVEVRVRY